MMGLFQSTVVEKVPVQERNRIREKMRVAADDAMFEDSDYEDRSGEKLNEGAFFNGQLRSFGGADGQPLKLNLGSLGDGISMVG